MPFYHCSPIAGLTLLEPRKPESFDKPEYVYMTSSLPMALMYGIRNFEYSYGYTKDGEIYYEEYFPDALKELYKGKHASLYICCPNSFEITRIPNERVSAQPVRVVEEIPISDIYEALMEQERLGALKILRHESLSTDQIAWIRKAEAAEIRKRNLLSACGPMAEYFRKHYPDSWIDAANELR